MFLQEGMHPETGPIAEQAPDLFLVELPRLVPGQRQAFEDMTRHVLLCPVQTGHNIIREVKRNVHEYHPLFFQHIVLSPLVVRAQN